MTSRLVFVLVFGLAGAVSRADEPPIRIKEMHHLASNVVNQARLVLTDSTGVAPALRTPLGVEPRPEALAALGPDKTWVLGVEGSGLWAEPGRFWRQGAASVTLRVWPTAAIVGRFNTSTPLPRNTVGTLAMSLLGSTGEDELRAEERCSVDGAAFRCIVPSAKLNISLKVPGYASVRRWGLKAKPGGELDLGVLSLTRGTSFCGYVRKGTRNGPPCVRCRVALRSDPGKTAESGQSSPKAPTTWSTVTDDHGFFQIVGTGNGRLPFMVGAPDCETYREHARLLPEMEAELSEPIVLRPARFLSVSGTPAQDLYGRPWRLILKEKRGELHVDVASGSFSAEKPWRTRCGEGRKYALQVETSRGEVWHFDPEVTVFSEDQQLRLDLRSIAVRGRVTLHGEPLASTVTLQDAGSGAGTTLKTDEAGEFSTKLPVAAHWRAKVSSAEAMVTRDVELEGCCEDGAFLEIALEDKGVIAGQVVDPKGRPVPHAILRYWAKTAEMEAQSLVLETGDFELRGLRPGDYWFAAEAATESGKVLQSENVSVTVAAENDASKRVTISLRDADVFSATVISVRTGQPLSGLRVQRTLPSIVSSGNPATVTTDATGRFFVEVPKGAERLCLLFLGGSVPAFLKGVSVAENGETIALDDVGGELTMEFPQKYVTPQGGVWPMLVRDDCLGMPSEVAVAAHRDVRDGVDRIAYRSIAGSGQWTLCLFDQKSLLGWPDVKPSSGACAYGEIQPNGHLLLSKD